MGIDLFSSSKKICSLNCIYCQLGSAARLRKKPGVYVETEKIIKELKQLPKIKIDYITFSGRGESGLAKNLGEAIKAVKKLKIAPVAVLTNASLIDQAEIRKNLSFADSVIAKLDAYSQESLEKINHPAKTITFRKILQGIKQFKKDFKGKFALQIMFTKENQDDAEELGRLAREINPDQVQINTPTRFCKVRPLSREAIAKIKKYFTGLNFISVYDSKPKKVVAFSRQETLRRRGKVI